MTQDETFNKVYDLAAEGRSDVLIARELNLTLAQVMRIRSSFTASGSEVRQVQQTTKSVSTPQGSMTIRATAVSNPQPAPTQKLKPKEMLERLAIEIDECLVVALSEYKADPTSETGYNALSSLATTFKELIKSRESLDDPQEIAESVVLQILRPMIYAVLKSLITSFDHVNKELSLTFNSDNQRHKFKETIQDMLKALTSDIKVDYNRGVHTLEDVYGVDLSHLFLKKADTTDV